MQQIDCINQQAREHGLTKRSQGLTKRSQAERLAIANSLIASVWEEYLNGSIDRSTLQVAAYIQANANRIVWKLNELNNPNTPNTLKALDCICRQEAIDAVMDEFKRIPTNAIRAKTRVEALQSAQPEPIRINLNEPIKVKLTDWGKEIYYHQYDRINQIVGREACKPSFPKEDENGYAEFQLWCFMELYGECMGMTLPNVIEPIEIVYER